MQQLSHIVADKRVEKDLTQAQLAEVAGVSRHTIVNIESGSIADMRMSTLEKVLNVFGYEVSALPIREPSAPSPNENSQAAERLANRLYRQRGANHAL